VILRLACVVAANAGPWGLPRRRKSFLLIFFKKEESCFLDQRQMNGAFRISPRAVPDGRARPGKS